MVVLGVEAANDFLEDLEADFLAVEIDTRPVAKHDGGLALLDHVHHAALVEVFADEVVQSAAARAVPAAGPIARAGDDRNDATRVGGIEARGVLDSRHNAVLAFANDVAKVVRNLGAEHVAAGFETRLSQLGQDLLAEAARRGNALAGQIDVVENL